MPNHLLETSLAFNFIPRVLWLITFLYCLLWVSDFQDQILFEHQYFHLSEVAKAIIIQAINPLGILIYRLF